VAYVAALDTTTGVVSLLSKLTADPSNGDLTSQGTIEANVDLTKNGVSVVTQDDGPGPGDVSGSFSGGLSVGSISGISLSDGQVWTYDGGGGSMTSAIIAGARHDIPAWAFSAQSGGPWSAWEQDSNQANGGWVTNAPGGLGGSLNDYIEYKAWLTSGSTFYLIVLYNQLPGVGGIVTVYVDGISWGTFDCLDGAGLGVYNVFAEFTGQTVTAPGEHTIKFEVTGTSDALSGAPYAARWTAFTVRYDT
jgi:hypothetical protein